MSAASHLRALSLLAEAIGGAAIAIEITAWHPARPALTRTWRVRSGHGHGLRTTRPGLLLPCAREGFADEASWRKALRLSVLRAVLCNAAGINEREAALLAAANPGGDSRVRKARAALRETWQAPARDRRSLLEQGLERLLQRAWVDLRIRRHYPGATHDLDAVLTLTRQRLGPCPGGPLRQILYGLTQSLLESDPTVMQVTTESALLAQAIQRSRAVLRPGATLQSCTEAAADIHRLLIERFPGSRPSLRRLTIAPVAMPIEASAANASTRMHGVNLQGHEQTEAGTDRARLADPAPDSPTEGSVADARSSRHALSGSVGTTTAQAGAAADLEPDETQDGEADRPDRDGSGPADPVMLSSRYGAGAGEAVGVYLIDEWDCHAKRYLPAWCRLTEWRLRGPERDLLTEVRREHPDLARQILERFAALRPVSYRRVKGVPDGDDLDLDGVVHAMIDRRAGGSSDERAWIRRERRDRDVATALLLDMSASTSLSLPAKASPAPLPRSTPPTDLDSTRGALLYGFYDDTPQAAAEQPRRRIIDVARDSLALMALGLAALGDDHAIYGFSGSGRDNVEFHVARDFDDPWRQRSLGSALAAIEPRGSTRMGPAIRHATLKLARRPALQRLLILVSDGYPQDIDYGPDRNDEGYGLQDTARALREAERAGVSTFCVTIDPAGHDYLRRMCTADGYRVIEEVQALPQALSEIYARLTGRA